MDAQHCGYQHKSSYHRIRFHRQGLGKGEGFAVDASVIEANASRYHGQAPDEIDWSRSERQTRAVAEYLGGLER